MHNPLEKKVKPRHISRLRGLRILILVLGLGLTAAIGATAGVIGAYYYVQPSLPAAETIRDIPLEVPLRIFSRDGYLISEIGERKRVPVSYEEVPRHVIDAFIAAEDRRFFEHSGIDYRGVLRAVLRLAQTGDASGGGGSTLTQQLARDYFLTREQTLSRKLKEAFLAYKIEQEFSKEQIMALFLNKMFFGQRAYGVAASAQVYFDKNLSEITVAEAATLAGVLPAPSRYNPVSNAENAKVRRGYVLGRMLDLGFIDDAEYEQAMSQPMQSRLHGAAIQLNAPYIAEMVRSQMLELYGEKSYTAGYQVVTTLDSRMQKAANYALRNGLLDFSRRRGYRGPKTRIELSEDTLTLPLDQWPAEIFDSLDQYAPGGLSLALVTRLGDNNEATILFHDGVSATLPWAGMSWANPFIDRENFGPAPNSADEVVAVGDVIYVMPTANGSWALAQVPEAQGAVVALDPYDGGVAALTGGFDYTTSKFNRARQAYRQPGSAFKPFIYSAALEYGNTPATVVLDAPVVISSSELEAVWRPINYSGRFYGPTRMREALVRSMNLVSVRLLLFETGIGNAIRHLAKFGFSDATLIRNGSLALGGGQASPLDMAQAYAILANGGHAIKPYVIDSIFGPAGEPLFRAYPAVVCDECVPETTGAEASVAQVDDPLTGDALIEQMMDVIDTYRPTATDAPELFENVNVAPQAISPQNAFLIQDMMRDVVFRGTGRKALVLGRRDLSGKTGTSNDRRDAWFGGFNADLAAVVWVGYDDDRPLGPGEEGSRTALPVWIDFARIALKGVPDHKMPMPEGIVSVKIDKQTGCPARAGQLDVMFEVFLEDNVPDCERMQDVSDPFNNAAGLDPEAVEETDDDEAPESLF
ncbi:MAG: PBP1A family penicillin-binding protein [Gammaproteobacteria bacterium]|nr:PBP1A family penicillin-binding protein [Gammaproteobacteria bacterium]